MSELTAAQRVKIARTPGRPGTLDFVNALFTDVFVCKGDRLHREDPSIFGAIARFHGRPVTVLGHRKGRTFEENMKCNFGMPSPEGYRKAQRLMRQAEKFGRPIFTFIDTPGAYPGLEAEAEGQAEAIASSLSLMSSLTVPVISVVTGEGAAAGRWPWRWATGSSCWRTRCTPSSPPRASPPSCGRTPAGPTRPLEL